MALAAAARRAPVPNLKIETACFEAGDGVVVGLDEVGRGAWAGPVTVGAVAITPGLRRIVKIRDSKVLTLEEREFLYPKIISWCLAWGVGHSSPAECDAYGMTLALKLAAERALAALPSCKPDRIILDGNFDYLEQPDRVRTVVDGDAKCLSVAAASIVAKVTRDRIMAAEAESYPGYDFDSNRGYPAPKHRCALLGYGPTAIHRRSWIFMDGLPWSYSPQPQGSLFG